MIYSFTQNLYATRFEKKIGEILYKNRCFLSKQVK